MKCTRKQKQSDLQNVRNVKYIRRRHFNVYIFDFFSHLLCLIQHRIVLRIFEKSKFHEEIEEN